MKIQLKVIPNAGKNEVIGWVDDVLKIKIAKPPTNGKANMELIEYLADVLGVAKNEITIKAGQTGRKKIVELNGLSVETFILKMQKIICRHESLRQDSDKRL